MTEQGCSSSVSCFDLAKTFVILWFTFAHSCCVESCGGQSSVPVQTVSRIEQELPVAGDQLRLRITWGGGVGQTWTGNVKATQGAFSRVVPLGLTTDSPASVSLVEGELMIHHGSAVNYGGADVTLRGTSETRVTLTLSSKENPEIQFEKELLLEDLISQTVGGDIDTMGNQFSIVRVPGDRLVVDFEREHLVFQPGERFQFSFQPNLAGMVTRTATGRIKVESANTRSFAANHFDSIEPVSFQLDEAGSADPAPVEIQVPDREGVYNIELELEPAWYQAPLRTRKNSIRRRIQILVLDEMPAPITGNQEWSQFSTADPVDPDRIGLASLSRFMGRSRESYGNELRSPVEVDGQTMMQIAPGGWQAIPLEMSSLNKPHQIEIDYVSNGTMAVGLSLLEFDSKGQVSHHGCDSGLFQPRSLVGDGNRGRIEQHRITVWPKTKTPYLLFANRHPDQPVTLGKIRVLAGPDRLDAKTTASSAGRATRKMMAFYESPLFAGNFGSANGLDSTSETLDDWNAFYHGADRLIQYLKTNAYRGAFLTVASDGSSIYPSRLLNSSPKYDNGTFFESGQDPIRKDVLEMLFRMFEREGLLLVPTIALTGPLPEIEKVRNRGEGAGIELVDLNQKRREANSGSGLPIYNPLDPSVQRAVNRVVDELAQRYRSHPSFDGIAVICRPDTYVMLPGRQWGNDDSTIKRFLDTQSDLDPIPGQWEGIQRVLLGSHRERWIEWRATQMSDWYHDLASELRQALPQGTLYLAPVDIYRNEEISSALSPSLHGSSDYEQLMLQIGFSKELVDGPPNEEGDPALVFLKPHRLAPDQPFAAQRVNWAVENSNQAHRFFTNSGYAGDLFTHRTSWAHFAQLQSQGIFKNQSSPLMRLQQMTPAAHFNRQRFVQAIKSRDARMLVDGGGMIAMGQEKAVADLMAVYGNLPDTPFSDVMGSRYANVNSMPVAIRQVKLENETSFYCVNASPWPVKLTLQVAGSAIDAASVIQSFSQAQFELLRRDPGLANVEQAETNVESWTVAVPPFGLVGGRSVDPEFNIIDFEFELPDNAEKDLRKRVYALQSKLNQSKNVQPMSVISNASFEQSAQSSPRDWNVGESLTGMVGLDSGSPSVGSVPELGNVSMAMKNEGAQPVWVRSNFFDAPQTGRLSISVWLRTNDPTKQPPLRLAVEGQSNGASYYRFGSVGSLSPDAESNQLDFHWKRFAVHFDDLPVSGLSNVRIGFDLMGPGEVFVDNVQVFDRWFDENDAKAITQLLASTRPLLARQEAFDSCRRLLEGYWARFLDEYFTSERLSKEASNRDVPDGEDPGERVSHRSDTRPPPVRDN